MKKKDLMRLIESEIKNKKNLNEDFYFGEMDENFEDDIMSDIDFVYDETESEPNSDEEEEADWYEWDSEEELPSPRSRRMNSPITIEPSIKPSIKPSKPDTEPEWSPDEDEPVIPSPDVNPEPQAPGEIDIIGGLKEHFNRSLNRLDNVTYKPIKYRKY